MSVLTDPEQLGKKHIAVSDKEKSTFLEKTYPTYTYRVLLTTLLLEWNPQTAMSVFDPHTFQAQKMNCPLMVKEEIFQLTNFCGVVQKVNVDGQAGVSQSDVVSEDEAYLYI